MGDNVRRHTHLGPQIILAKKVRHERGQVSVCSDLPSTLLYIEHRVAVCNAPCGLNHSKAGAHLGQERICKGLCANIVTMQIARGNLCNLGSG